MAIRKCHVWAVCNLKVIDHSHLVRIITTNSEILPSMSRPTTLLSYTIHMSWVIEARHQSAPSPG